MFKKNAGKYFEEWIDYANKQYAERGLAVISKIPTPWQVQRKYSPYKKTYEISSAFPMHKSTVDFGGTAQKHSIWFDAKVTKHKTSFPLSNIHRHQIEYLKEVDQVGGKAFLLIFSEHLNKCWLLWIDKLMDFIKSQNRKSLPFSWLDEHCPIVKPQHGIALDYLSVVLQQRED